MDLNVLWETFSPDLSGKDTVGIQIVEEDSHPFRFVRRSFDDSKEELLGSLSEREMHFLRTQIDSSLMKLRTQDYE